jgi:hypothetical protein
MERTHIELMELLLIKESDKLNQMYDLLASLERQKKVH